MGDADVLGIAKRAAGDFLGHSRGLSKLAAIAEANHLRQTYFSAPAPSQYETVPMKRVTLSNPRRQCRITITLHYIGGCSSRERAMAVCKRSTA
jgi:hypothetical protein